MRGLCRPPQAVAPLAMCYPGLAGGTLKRPGNSPIQNNCPNFCCCNGLGCLPVVNGTTAHKGFFPHYLTRLCAFHVEADHDEAITWARSALQDEQSDQRAARPGTRENLRANERLGAPLSMVKSQEKEGVT
jgi:hypothetical protein